MLAQSLSPALSLKYTHTHTTAEINTQYNVKAYWRWRQTHGNTHTSMHTHKYKQVTGRDRYQQRLRRASCVCLSLGELNMRSDLLSGAYVYKCVCKYVKILELPVFPHVLPLLGAILVMFEQLFWWICNVFNFLHLRRPAMIELSALSKSTTSKRNNETAVIAVKKNLLF